MKIFNRYPSDVYEKLSLKMKKSLESAKGLVQYQFNTYLNKKAGLLPIRILCVLDRSCNIKYLSWMLAMQKAWGWIEYKVVDLVQYLNEDEYDYDLLIYQTWSCEVDYAPLADQKFLETSVPKVLFDAHASGSFDTYYRFNNPNLPRIKNAPHKKFLEDFNVICKTSHPVETLKDKRVTKNVDISYCVGLQTHEVRPKIYEKVMPYQNRCKVDLKNNQHNYVSYLRRVKISVNAPGYGEGTFRHLYSLNAKALLFAHDSIESIQLLPYAELVPGVDYISFNLDNFDEKMQWCLDHPKEIEAIAQKGYEKFIQGYNVKRSAQDLYTVLSDLVKAKASFKA